MTLAVTFFISDQFKKLHWRWYYDNIGFRLEAVKYAFTFSNTVVTEWSVLCDEIIECNLLTGLKQELSYRKQIARQLHKH